MNHIAKKSAITIALVLIALLAFQAKAQWAVGVEAGYDYNSHHLNTQYAYDFRYEGRGGLTIGIPIEYRIFNWFAVRADLTYIERGFKMHRKYNETFQNRRDHYLSLPIMARFMFGSQRIKGFLHAGGYVGYWLKSSLDGCEMSLTSIFDGMENKNNGKVFYSYQKDYTFNPTRDNRFDAGLAGGIGVSYRILPRLEVEIEGRCYYGLTSTTKHYMKHVKQSRFNTTIAVLAGIKYCF